MVTTWVVGVDGGGTKTVAVLADAVGHEIARATGAGSNLQTVGPVVVRDRLADLFGQLLAMVGTSGVIRGLTVSLAGVDRPADIPVATRAILDAIEQVQSTHPTGQWQLPNATPSVTNDAVAALAAGARTLDGIVVIAGTGSIALGICDGQRARAGGWGSILGDEGSGYALGDAALRAVCRAHDRRGAPTVLTNKVLAHLGVDAAPDLIGVVSGASWGVSQTAAIAPLVVESAEIGDTVAMALIDQAASELAQAVLAVIDALPFDPTRALAVVLAGGLWGASARLRVGFTDRVRAVAPFAHPAISDAEPVLGAVWLACRQLE